MIVVPMLAPIMTATLCDMDIRPAEMKPDQDHGGYGGRLDDGRHKGTHANAYKTVSGQLPENVFHVVAGRRLQRLGHYVHAKKEEGQTTKQSGPQTKTRNRVIHSQYRSYLPCS